MLDFRFANLKTLAIDTASEICGVGVADASELLSLEELPLSAARSRNLAPLIVAALSQARVALTEIKLIAVSAGPGSFNGLRVGLASAYGLGAALASDILSVSTLLAMAWSIGADSRPRLVVLDARRGEVFAARFEVTDGGLRRVTDDILTSRAGVVALARAGDLVLVSAGRHGEFAGLGQESQAFATSAVRGLVRCAHASAESGRGEAATMASYLREPR